MFRLIIVLLLMNVELKSLIQLRFQIITLLIILYSLPQFEECVMLFMYVVCNSYEAGFV